METHWLERWWAELSNILRHPWHSLVSLLAAVGGLIVWIWTLLVRVAVWCRHWVHRLWGFSLWQMAKAAFYTVLVLCVLGVLGTIYLITYPQTKRPAFQPVDQHVYLTQGAGWTGGQNEPLRQLFYYTPQGAGVKDVRYSWFVNLEVPWGKTKFADPERMSAYGFLVDDAPTPLNPDRLPVGFTSHYDAELGEKVLDLSCAACHTGELTVNKNGKRYGLRVDGGPAMHAFTAMHIGDFAPELLGSLASTYLNPFKFSRFARPVLGATYPEGRWKLHGDVRRVIWALLRQAWNDQHRHLYPTEEGPGRIDALGRIANTVFGDELSATNYKISDAPVRYPPLWDIWKFNYVQYNASVRQPMTRNVSESLGVGGGAQLLTPYGGPIARDQHFDTTVMMDNLYGLERALWSLEPPRWSEDCLGKINWDKARKGRVLFENICQRCHGPFPASDPVKEGFAYLKGPGYQAAVLKDWQEFMDNLYEPPQPDQSTVPPPPPGPDQVGVMFSTTKHGARPEDQARPPLFNPVQQKLAEGESDQEHAGQPMSVQGESHRKPAGQPALVPGFTNVVPAGRHEESEEDKPRLAGSAPPRATGTAPHVYSDFPLWMMHPLAVDDIGTDPTAAVNFVEKTFDLRPAGLISGVAIEGMRTLLEQDLSDTTDAYAADILRLKPGVGTGRVGEAMCQQMCATRLDPMLAAACGCIRQLSDSERELLRAKALAIVNQLKQAPETSPPTANDAASKPVAPDDQEKQKEKDAADLQADVQQFENAITIGPSQINNFLASLDISKLNTGVALRLIVFRARRRFYDLRRYNEDERDEMNGFGELDVPKPLAQYKPRPLAGIWAAGPFLHNGSVPTIYQLLLPADQRDKKFFVGTRDFDPVNLGLSTQPTEGREGFWFDTSITGNSNVGHEFRKGYVPWQAGGPPRYGVIGPELTEEERQDIIEYLKIHRDEHAAPASGPKDASDKGKKAKDADAYLKEGLDTINLCQ
jgi:hypothetical protein